MTFKKGDYLLFFKGDIIMKVISFNPANINKWWDDYKLDILNNTNQGIVNLSKDYIDRKCKKISKDEAMVLLI